MPGLSSHCAPFIHLTIQHHTEGSGTPTHKGGTWPEQGEDAAENKADHVIYHPKQEIFEKGTETINLCGDITLGLSPAILLVTWPI